MTDDKYKAFERKIEYVNEVIKEVETKIGKEVVCCGSACQRDSNWYASYMGKISMLWYDIPYSIFMELPPKQLVIEIMRALTIDFNEYENEQKS